MWLSASNRRRPTSLRATMDPHNPASFNHRTERLSSGRTYHFVDQRPDNYEHTTKPTLLCVHGFPDLWYGWRYQISPWVRKGFRVVAPDMLGYGETDKPAEPSEYSTKRLCADLNALLDVLGVKQAVVIGHDWGSYVAGRFALWYPNRLLALIMLSVPFTPPSREYVPIEEVAKRVPNFGYQAYFADEKSTSEIESNLHRFIALTFQSLGSGHQYTHLGSLRKLLSGDEIVESKTPDVLTDIESKYYYQELKKGMRGPLNYYRTAKFRHDEEQAAALSTVLRPDLPVLFIWGSKDPTAVPTQIVGARKFIPRLQDIALEGRGHWLMVEAKEDVAEKVVNWLDMLDHRNKSKL